MFFPSHGIWIASNILLMAVARIYKQTAGGKGQSQISKAKRQTDRKEKFRFDLELNV